MVIEWFVEQESALRSRLDSDILHHYVIDFLGWVPFDDKKGYRDVLLKMLRQSDLSSPSTKSLETIKMNEAM